jgi:hypothetical protein
MSDEEYEFYIDAYTPSTIPMARLAQYMSELASLFGNQKDVHFSRVKKGSLRLFAKVNFEAIPKVRQRLQNARDPGAPTELRRPYKRIDEMLRDDNAVGKLRRGKSNVIAFPGRRAARDMRMGPFTEQTSIDGKIVRVGGTDATAHVLLEEADGEVRSAECSRDLAVRLAPFLYTRTVRLIGNARWLRTEQGEWELLSFRAKDFVPLTDDDLSSAINKLRNIESEWRSDPDPAALLRKLRGGNGEAH